MQNTEGKSINATLSKYQKPHKEINNNNNNNNINYNNNLNNNYNYSNSNKDNYNNNKSTGKADPCNSSRIGRYSKG